METIADIKEAIGKGWIANVKDSEIMQNPILARIIKGQGVDRSAGAVPANRNKKAKGLTRPILDFLLKCPRCGQAQHEYMYQVSDKPWIKCEHCQQLSPIDSCSVICWTSKQSFIPAR